jgi:hypothetical protein
MMSTVVPHSRNHSMTSSTVNDVFVSSSSSRRLFYRDKSRNGGEKKEKMHDKTNGFRGRRRSAVVVNSATPPPPLPLSPSLEVPAIIKNISFFGFFDEAAKAASVQDATAEHLIEAFEQLPKRDQVLMVKKLLNGALREDEVRTRVMEEAMVMEEEKRTAPEVKIRNVDDDDDEKKPSISSSSSSSSSAPTTVTDEREILERAVREMPNASPEQREKAAEILRRLEEETERVRMQSEGKEDDDFRSNRLEKDFENNEETENRGEDNSPFEDEDIVWDLRSAVASLTTVAKAKLIPPLAFGTGFAALALVLTKFIGGDDAGNETIMDDARRNDNDDDARASPPPPPPSTSSAIMNDRNDGDSGDVASPLLPMEEAKRLLFESQAIQPPRTMTAAKSNAQKILKNRRRGVASTKNTSSASNGNGVLWKRKEEEEEEEDEALELEALEENEDFEEPFEDEDENENAEEESIALATAKGNEDEDEDEDEDDEAELPPPPPTTATNKKQRRRPPPDLTSASFLSEEDREKNFDDIRARRPR